MPLPDDRKSQGGSILISSFSGLDAARALVSNDTFSVGQTATNIGRKTRQPLQPRLGLRPVTSENGNHVFSGECFAMGAIASGNRLSLVMRVSGGRMLAATDVELT